MTLSRRRILIAAILFGALFLRLWQLGGKSLWLDEATSWSFARRPIAEIMTNTNETNPPVYYALLHGWISLFGHSEASLRFPSLIFSMLAVLLMAWVGKQLGGPEVAVGSMMLMAFLSMPIRYAQTARAYSLFLAAALASYGSLLMWLKARKLRWSLAYVFSTIVMCYAHNFWMFTFFAQQVYVGWLIVRRRAALLPWLGMSAAVILGYSPWLAVLFKQAADLQSEGFWIKEPHLAIFWKTIQINLFYNFARTYVLFFIPLIAAGIFIFRKKASADISNPSLLFATWFICPILLPYLVSKVSTPILVPRYTIAAAPVLYLLIAFAFAALSRKGRLAAGLILAAAAAFNLAEYYRHEWEDWRSAIATLTAQAAADDAVVTMAASMSKRSTPFEYYYRGSAPYFPWPSKITGIMQIGDWEEKFSRQLEGHSRVWIVMRDASLLSSSQLFALMNQRYPRARQFYKRAFPQKIAIFGYELSGKASGL